MKAELVWGPHGDPFRIPAAPSEHEQVLAAFQWLSELVAGYSYHKGWRFHVRHHQVMDNDPGRVAMIVDAEFANVERPAFGVSRQHIGTEHDMTQLAVARDEAAVDAQVWRMIADIEAHERCEWLRRHDRPVLDPHPEGVLGPPRLAP